MSQTKLSIARFTLPQMPQSHLNQSRNTFSFVCARKRNNYARLSQFSLLSTPFTTPLMAQVCMPTAASDHSEAIGCGVLPPSDELKHHQLRTPTYISLINASHDCLRLRLRLLFVPFMVYPTSRVCVINSVPERLPPTKTHLRGWRKAVAYPQNDRNLFVWLFHTECL